METQQQINTSNIQNIDEVFANLSYDKKILYLCAVSIKRYGNTYLKKMINDWLNNDFDDFEKYFPDVYSNKISQTKAYWSDSKIKSVELCLKKIFPPTEDKIVLEMEILEEAINLFKMKTYP